MLRLRALDHVGLKGKDLDKTLDFYKRLGLTVLRTKGPHADGLRSAVIQVGSQELNAFCHPEYVSSGGDNAVGIDHFCFEVDAASIDDVIADLRGTGIDVVRGPAERRDGISVVIHDPDGVRVELQLKSRLGPIDNVGERQDMSTSLGVETAHRIRGRALNRVRRRQFLMTAGSVLAAPLTVFGQQPAAAIPRIGFLGASTPEAWASRVNAFRAGLRDLGYVEGKNIVIEFRFAQGQYGRLPELAAELVRLKVDVIVTHSVPGALAAKHATAANPIPVVMTNVGDAIGSGIVASLARPDGNVTGDTFFVTEFVAKRLELLKDAIPRMRRVAVLANPDNAGMPRYVQSAETAAKALNLVLVRVDARGPSDLDSAFAAVARESADALTVIEDVPLIASFKRIAELAAKQRLPSISFIEYADAGGLFGYGADFLALYRRAPFFVDKILKGAKPADIPIERPTKFEFVINMQTAKALGLTIPNAIRLRADREIQ